MNFHVKVLKNDDVEHAHKLHDFVCNHLAKLNIHALSFKTIEDIKYEIEKHITVGVFDHKNNLIGKSTLLMNPTGEEKEFEARAHNHKGFGVLRSTCIHPEYQKKGLSKKIMNLILEKSNGALVGSTIILDNLVSLKNRIDQGFALFQIAGNKVENMNVYCLIHVNQKLHDIVEHKLIHYQDLKNVMHALNEGYIGSAISPDGTIKFIKHDEIRDFVGCREKSWVL